MEKPKIKLKAPPILDSVDMTPIPPKIKIKIKDGYQTSPPTESKIKIKIKDGYQTSPPTESKIKMKIKDGYQTLSLQQPSAPALNFPKNIQKLKLNDFCIVKTSLKSILKNYEQDFPRINQLVIECHQIVTRTYQLIKLYLLDQYRRIQQQSLPIPNSLFPPMKKTVKGKTFLSTDIDETLILYFIRAGGLREKRRPSNNPEFAQDLDEFIFANTNPSWVRKNMI